MPTGKEANNFAQEGKFLNRAFALECIEHANKSWEHLLKGGYAATPEKQKGVSLANTTLKETSLHLSDVKEAEKLVLEESKAFANAPADLDEDARQTCAKVFYIDRSKL